MSWTDADENGLPIPPAPQAIEAMFDPRDKQRAVELWHAANRLLAVLYHWEAWWREFLHGRVRDTGLPIHWYMIARDCLRAIFLHGAGGHVAPGASLDEVTDWLYPCPDGELSPIWGLTSEGRWDCIAQRYPPPWRVRLKEWAAEHLSAARNKVYRLIGGLRGGLLDLLRKFPAAALTPQSEAPARQTPASGTANQSGSAQPADRTKPVKPRWDGETRTLFWGSASVRAYRKNPAKNQMDLLEAFEAAGWPRTLANPFGTDTVKLSNTVRDLNRHLVPGTIRFHLDGYGAQGVDWRPAPGEGEN
jgi:hypothetical protein